MRNPNMNVSTEGMRPESLNALDMLGKYFFEHTGKPLILNAGTNGDHANGEFSHYNGWKAQFIKYGRSLKLVFIKV